MHRVEWNPEWVEPSGESSKCDFYEARLMQLRHSDAKGAKLKLEKLYGTETRFSTTV